MGKRWGAASASTGSDGGIESKPAFWGFIFKCIYLCAHRKREKKAAKFDDCDFSVPLT